MAKHILIKPYNLLPIPFVPCGSNFSMMLTLCLDLHTKHDIILKNLNINKSDTTLLFSEIIQNYVYIFNTPSICNH